MSLSLILILAAAIIVPIWFRIARHGLGKGLLLSGVILGARGIQWVLSSHGDQAAVATVTAPPGGGKSALYRTESGAELQIRLAELKRRESDLQLRKAEMVPGDQTEAKALTQEIAKYNADLKPVLEKLQQRPDLAP